MIKKAFYNITLRGFSLLGKFILILILAKELSAAELGVFGIFTTTVVLAIILLGLDFYNFSNREMLEKGNKISLYIFNQLTLSFFAYIIILPIFYLVFLFNFIPIEYMWWFYGLVILEHLSQEIFRIFTILQLPEFANIIYFLRTGFWIYVLLFLWFIGVMDISLSNIFLFWSVGVFLSIVLSFIKLNNLNYLSIHPIDFLWIKRGLKVGLLFFVGTIAYKIIEFSDRYILDIVLGKSAVGIYTLYNNVANVINAFTFVSVIMIYYPKLIKLKNNKISFEKESKYFLYHTFITSILLAVALVFLISPILDVVNKKIYYEHLNVFYILIFSNIILNLSFVPHYILYSLKKDYIIIYASIVGAIVNITLNLIFIKLWGIFGVAVATLLSYSVLLLFKYINVRVYR